MHGVSAIIATVSSTLSRQEGDSIQTVDDEGQTNLIDAAVGTVVSQFVYVSFCAMHGESPLQTAKRKVEKHLAGSGLNYTILQPTFFYGKYG
ncbi:MAG: NAD(P)H-binding protein [Ignavibacteria bacterium]|nr:NAD(P)H-binding protein [Ignavibacteria bacterium]